MGRGDSGDQESVEGLNQSFLSRIFKRRPAVSETTPKQETAKPDPIEQGLQQILSSADRAVDRTEVFNSQEVEVEASEEAIRQIGGHKNLQQLVETVVENQNWDNHVVQRLISAPPEQHTLGWLQEITIADYNENPFQDEVALHPQPTLGEMYTIDLARLEEVVSEWEGSENRKLLKEIQSLQQDGQESLQMRLVGFSIEHPAGNVDLTSEESRSIFPYMLDQDGRAVIDDSILLTVTHPTLGDVPTLHAIYFDELDRINAQVTHLEKVYSSDPELYKERSAPANTLSIRSVDDEDFDDEERR